MSSVASPCISICQMNTDTDWCEGCWRTIDEIAEWGVMSDGEKRKVWMTIFARKRAHRQANEADTGDMPDDAHTVAPEGTSPRRTKDAS